MRENGFDQSQIVAGGDVGGGSKAVADVETKTENIVEEAKATVGGPSVG